MKYLLILTLAVVTAAFAGVTDTHFTGENWNTGGTVDYGLKDTLVDNLCTTSGQITNGYSAGTIGGAYNRWIAFDYLPSGDDYSIEGFHDHWLYYAGGTDLGDTLFEIYEADLNTAPVYSIFVDVADIVESDSGLDAFGRDVYLTEYDFLGQSDEWDATDGTLYWVALQMDTPSDNPFHAVREDSIIEDMCWWYGDVGYWANSYDSFGETAEGSYALFGVVGGAAIESASLGTLKASFK